MSESELQALTVQFFMPPEAELEAAPLTELDMRATKLARTLLGLLLETACILMTDEDRLYTWLIPMSM